eukprot:716816-Prorocentrum_minimum.AAC.1
MYVRALWQALFGGTTEDNSCGSEDDDFCPGEGRRRRKKQASPGLQWTCQVGHKGRRGGCRGAVWGRCLGCDWATVGVPGGTARWPSVVDGWCRSHVTGH